jgi:hypothetical protein
MIEKNIKFSEFYSQGFFDETDHDRAGFYALLLAAQDYDYLQIGSLDLLTLHPDVSFSKEEPIWRINCNTIMVGTQMLSQYFRSNVKRQKYPMIWWRDTSAMFYDLVRPFKSPNRLSFADGLKAGAWSDIPQFRGISRGYGKSGELQLIVDINGAFHLSYSGGAGKLYGRSYVEGYLCTWRLDNGCLGNTPSPSEVTSTIDGMCFSNDLVLIGGVNASPICSGIHLLTEGNYSAITTFYVGSIGYGFGGSLTLPLSLFGIAPIPAWGWKWALDDQMNGVTMSNISAQKWKEQ